MQTNTLQPISLDFDGHPVTAVKFRGRWCWLPSQIAVAIGYDQSSRIAKRISSEWADEFIAGHDYDVISGPDLRDLRSLLELSPKFGPSSVEKYAPRVTVLYESGLHLALLRTRKPAGKKLRRLLAEQVLPQLARDGRYDPEHQVHTSGARGLTVRELDIRERELDLRKRELEISGATVLRQLVTDLHARGRVDEDILVTYEVVAAEIHSGRSLPALKPPADESLSWESPTQIAERLGVSVQRVGRTISALRLRGAEGLSRAILNKAKTHDRTVTSYLYSPTAVLEIETTLAGTQ